jgi:hypothetical protein
MFTENFEHRHDLQRDIERANFTFLLLLVVGPLAALLSRLSAKMLPIEKLFAKFTSYPPEKISAESVRILTEGADLGYYVVVLSCLLVCFVGFYLVIKNERQPLDLRQVKDINAFLKIVTPLTFVMVGLHFATLHPWRIESFGQRFLDGFGVGPVIISMGLALTINHVVQKYLLTEQVTPSGKIQWFLALLGGLILVPQLFVFGRVIGANREYLIVYNEYAASSGGLRPLDTFAATYTSLSGILIKPIISLVNPDHALYVLMIFHIVITCILVFALVLLARQILGMDWGVTIFSLAILISPRQHNALAQGFLPSTSAPGRYMLPIFLLILMGVFFSKPSPTVRQGLLLGVLWGIAVTNNAEIGIPLSISVLTALCAKFMLDKKFFANLLTPILTSFITFVSLLYLLGGHNVHHAFQKWSVFVTGRAQGGFIGGVPVFGVHHFALAFHGTTLFLALLLIVAKRSIRDRETLGSKALMCVLLGVFGILTFPYYLSQNGPSFIGGFLWLPLVLTAFAFVGLMREIYNVETSTELKRVKRLTVSFTSPISFGLLALSVCSFLFIPDPQDSIGIHFRDDYPTWSPDIFGADPVIQELRTALSQEEDGSAVAYYGEYGNLISVIYGIESVYGTHDPMIAHSSRKTLNANCEPLIVRHPKVVLASKRFLPLIYLESKETDGPCPGLIKDMEYSSELLVRYVYTQP